MDKQKQIEEMAKDRVAELRLFYNFCKYNGCEEKTAEDCENCYFRKVYNRLAELEGEIRNGTLKEIPENAVVLTGMETEQRFEDLMVAFDEMGFMPNTTHPFPEEYVETWKQRLIFVFGQLRKETAEKFAERLKSDVSEDNELHEALNKYLKRDYFEYIDENCKEITEGKS